MTSYLCVLYVLALVTAISADTMSSCGGTLTANRGIIQTPNFPNKFIVPINCIWIIDASATQTSDNQSIVIYLTQQYVLSGLKFTEYLYYSDDYPAMNIIHRKPFELNEDAVTEVSWLQFNSPFLMVEFTMTELHGTHLRALDQLLDVYGFNITYEMDTIKDYQCNTLKCRFMGHCFANSDFSSYYCDCHPGFSSKDCGHGPMCNEGDTNYCQNGGICKHMGAISVNCLCPSGFKGEKCEISQIEDLSGCNPGDTICDRQCIFTGPERDVCNCGPSMDNSHRERSRYEATIHLANSSAFINNDNNNNNYNKGGSDIKINENLPTFLEKHISRGLRTFNITKISDSEMFSTSKSDIKLQFISGRNQGAKIRETIEKILMEKGRLGNFSSSLLEFYQDVTLNINSIAVKPNLDIREETEFELICIAKGSMNMKFQWYKDGIFIDLSRSTRKIFEETQRHEYYYENHLVVSKASKLDEGVYTCQVSDFDVQLCRSITIHIMGKLDIRIVPPSATVYRGESLRIRCISYGIHQSHGQLGYSWTKNGILFKSNSKLEMWEDLYPYGSILKISSVQKSANYTCISSSKVGRFSKSVYVYVVDRESVELCPNNKIFGVKWSASSPGSPTLGDCPHKYSGQSKRICEQRDFGKPMWLTPDFSQCYSDILINIYNQFRELTFGYQKTNSSAILNSCLEYAINRHKNFLPGEAGFLLGILHEVDKYLQLKGIHSEREIAAAVILRILDILMQSENSLNNQQQVKQLQELVQSSILNRETLTSPLLLPSTSLRNQQMHSFRIYKEHIKMLPFHSQIYGDHLFSDQLYMEIIHNKTLEKFTLDGMLLLSVVSYKNLTNFLPRMYFERNSFATDINYILASRIITTTLYRANQKYNLFQIEPLYLNMIDAHTEIIFQHDNLPNDDWISICGYDSQATFEATWQTDRCITETIMENSTKCNCPISGAFVLLQTKKNFNASTIRTAARPMFVIVSCGFCFLQSCIAFAILLPVLYNRKCPVTFLKMQFCTSTSTAMAIFTLGLLKLLPQDWHGIISSSLAGVLLLGTSTLFGITLIIQSELGPRKNTSSTSLASGSRGAIGLSWFLPILYTISSPLVYSIIGQWPINWWLEFGYFSFIMFVIIELLYFILFCLLCVTLLAKLWYLAKKNDKHNATISRSIGLIYRTALLLILKIIVDIFYLIYLNLNEFNLSYIFGISSFFLGFAILFCFVIKAEVKLTSEPMINKKLAKHSIEDYCSGSINGPLSFYTNHDTERDNDSTPLPPSGTKLPLTLLATSQCKLVPLSSKHLDTFLTVESGTADASYLGLENKKSSIATDTSNFRRCFDLEEIHSHPPDFYDNFKTEQIKCCNNNNNNYNNIEMNGVGTLDILKGLSQESIIGIRNSNLIDNSNKTVVQSMESHEKCQHVSNVKHQNISTISSSHQHTLPLESDKPSNTMAITILPAAIMKATTITTETATSQTSSQSISTTTTTPPPQPPPPTITITSADDKNVIDGMLNRISDDLDYLLNRTSEIPSRRINNKQIETEVTSQSSISSISSTSSASTLSSASSSASTVPIILSVAQQQQQLQQPSFSPLLSSSVQQSSSSLLNVVTATTANNIIPNSNCSFSIHDVILEECED